MNKRIRTPFSAILLIVISVLRILNLIDVYNQLYHWTIFEFLTNDILNIIRISLTLALAIVLFAKKYDNILVVVIGCQTLLRIAYLVNYFSIANLLSLIADAFLAVFAISVCEQTLIKADLSKIKEIAFKFFYLPAIIYLVSQIYSLIEVISFLNILIILLYAIVLFDLGMWLKDPYSKKQPIVAVEGNSGSFEEEQGEAYCGLGKHILLLLFTFGIWHLIWTYRTTKYLNKSPNAEVYNPTSKLLLYIFVPFYSIYWFYRHGQRIDSFTKSKGLNDSNMAMICLILGIFIPIVACILMQDKINTLCAVKAVNKTN